MLRYAASHTVQVRLIKDTRLTNATDIYEIIGSDTRAPRLRCLLCANSFHKYLSLFVCLSIYFCLSVTSLSLVLSLCICIVLSPYYQHTSKYLLKVCALCVNSLVRQNKFLTQAETRVYKSIVEPVFCYTAESTADAVEIQRKNKQQKCILRQTLRKVKRDTISNVRIRDSSSVRRLWWRGTTNLAQRARWVVRGKDGVIACEYKMLLCNRT